ncbi:MAG TPA: AAA family ATPase [Solirubrobacterales bacterium]|nr:AAA family ATPase [Solirubrobacterales bacterium]
MRISSARIQGYRCVADINVSFEGLTAFVGSGGVGKSTILNALDWFFHGGGIAERDLHRPADAEEPVASVAVAVTFSDLSDGDRTALGRYVDGDTTTLTRTWSEADGEKLSGNALVFSDFEHVREADGAMELRRRYRELHEQRGEELGLPVPAGNREQVERDMEMWERAHPGDCDLRPQDARHLGGFTGTPLLATRINYVLVGAAAGAPEALGGGRGSVLDRLLSAVEELNADVRGAITRLQEEAQGEIETVVADARGEVLVSIGAGITKRMETYFPGAAIKLEDEVAPPRPPQISVRALVSDRGGHPIEPDLQGHGLQRALVIALLHELAETAPLADAAAEADTRALVLAIEEPELYQHPLQARTLAASLEKLALDETERSIQVAYSTHSPYFTRPALFRDLRLCRRDATGGTSCVAADADAIAEAIATAGFTGEIANRVEAALATNLREAIFASVVLLCEGPTDASLLEGVAAPQGGLDRDGIGLAPCGSKSSVGIAISILKQLRIPYFALFDADAANQNPQEAELNRRLLELCDEQPEDWPKRAARTTSANFEDTMESDLAQLWPQLGEERKRVADELGIKGDKKARVYREAATRAGEPPEFLVDVLDAARKLL